MKMMHLYQCESCKLDFGVSTDFLETEKIVCPVCNTDTTMIDCMQEVKYRILRTGSDAAEVNLYGMFEREFGRMLSPFEAQMINAWSQKHSADVIKLALREASIRNIKQMKYIDRILVNWEQEGVTTVAEAMEISKRHGKKVTVDHEVHEVTPSNLPEGFFYNWLEEEAAQ